MHRNASIGSLWGITKSGIKKQVHRTLPWFNILLPLRPVQWGKVLALYEKLPSATGGNQTAELGQMSLLPVSDGIFWTVSSPKMSAKVETAGVNWAK